MAKKENNNSVSICAYVNLWEAWIGEQMTDN